MIYLAPLQGHTDYIYRRAYSTVFPGIDTFFVPYISVKNDLILNKYFAEIEPGNNLLEARVIPQILVKNEKEIVFLSEVLKDFGYKEINLNLDCPYPMVTNRGKGAGLLPNAEQIKKILYAFYNKSHLKLSVKMRAGLENEKEIEKVLPVLNSFPLTEIILHPRNAKQLYKGKIAEQAYSFALENTEHKLVYNGDIFSVEHFREKQSKFPGTAGWMLGRGVLMNPFLPSQINGISFSLREKGEKLVDFHRLIFEGTYARMDNEGNVLNKMRQFWNYFSYNFNAQKKAYKRIKKANSIKSYLAEVNNLLSENFR
ncbi:tRNA-dihydrouridine synthase family protein [Maribellus comscasis]|uniref:tRNA-dihydrouridine synthase n=2 Tax=Maribellus comscasis TaxID=2681766 RepID=A0A6I6JTB8_9BACT|nr:tRNA-dihydrouridine synthase family protein [Maribellus comscasis]